MKELIGVFCALVSVVSACVAIDAMKKCADAEDEKTSKKDDNQDGDFVCSASDDCCDCFEDVDIDDVEDVDIEVEPSAKTEDVPSDSNVDVEFKDEPEDQPTTTKEDKSNDETKE
jgi:hypothetical protein